MPKKADRTRPDRSWPCAPMRYGPSSDAELRLKSQKIPYIIINTLPDPLQRTRPQSPIYKIFVTPLTPTNPA